MCVCVCVLIIWSKMQINIWDMWLGPTAKWGKTAWASIFAGRQVYSQWALMWVRMWQSELQWCKFMCVWGEGGSRVCFICMNTHLNVVKQDVHQVLDTLHSVRNTWLKHFCFLITHAVNFKVSSWMGSFSHGIFNTMWASTTDDIPWAWTVLSDWCCT